MATTAQVGARFQLGTAVFEVMHEEDQQPSEWVRLHDGTFVWVVWSKGADGTWKADDATWIPTRDAVRVG